MYSLFLQSDASSPLSSLLMMGLIFAVMYFFMIRPQVKKQKAEKKFQNEVKKGDRVVMTSGIHGKVVELTDTACVVETGAGKIKFERAAISQEMTAAVYGGESAEAKK